MMKTLVNILILFICCSLLSSCEKPYEKFENLEIIQNTYTGNIELTSDWMFTGNNDSGVYSFVFENQNKRCEALLNSTTQTGEVRVIFNDANGDIVLNEVISSESLVSELTGLSNKGEEGSWLVTLNFTNYTGTGALFVSPM